MIFQTVLGRGIILCDSSVAVVGKRWFPARLGLQHTFHKRKKKNAKGLTSKLDTSLDSPGNHKVTFLKMVECAISTHLYRLLR